MDKEVWLKPVQVFDGARLRHDCVLRVADGLVDVFDQAPDGANVRSMKATVTPGFVDLQVNGGGGVLVNQTPTRNGLMQIADAHRKFGTVAVMPTVITDTPQVIAAAADAAIAADGTHGIVGLHIEGPHIAQDKRGTHDGDLVRMMSDDTLDVVGKLRRAGVVVKLTLAPEAATPAQIAQLVKMGAIVSIGHTNAKAEAVRAALDAGASCFTHLFNAMSQMEGREAGAVGTAINSDAYCGIICDGHHVNDAMIGLAIRARPVPDRMFLVSDAMPSVGGPDQFSLYGQTITLKGGKLINADGNLAGAHVAQAQGVQRLVKHVGLSLEAALCMAISVPAALIQQPALASLVGRGVGDVLCLDAACNVIGTLDAVLEQGEDNNDGA